MAKTLKRLLSAVDPVAILLEQGEQVLKEVDRRKTIVQKIGFPQEFADWAHGISDKRSLWIANTFKSVIEGEHPGIMKVIQTDGLDTKWDDIQNLGVYIQEKVKELEPLYTKVIEWAKKEGAKGSAPEIEKMSIEDAYQLAIKSEQQGITDPAGVVTLTYPDGFYWVDLQTSQCPEEGEAMNHCATAASGEGATLFSLRDKNRKSHVTIELNKKTNSLHQIKGNSNRKPDQKYSPYILDFMIKTPEALEYDVGSNSDWKFTDFTKEQQEELRKEKPELAAPRTLQDLYDDAIEHGGEMDFNPEDWGRGGRYIEWTKDNYGFTGIADSFNDLNNTFDVLDYLEQTTVSVLGVEGGRRYSRSLKDITEAAVELYKDPEEAIQLILAGNDPKIGWDDDNSEIIANKARETRYAEWMRAIESQLESDREEANVLIARALFTKEQIADLEKVVRAAVAQAQRMTEDYFASVLGFGKNPNGTGYVVHVDGNYELFDIIGNYLSDNYGPAPSLPMDIEDLVTGSDFLRKRQKNGNSLDEIAGDEVAELTKQMMEGGYNNAFDYFFNKAAAPILQELTIPPRPSDIDPRQLKFPFALNEIWEWINSDN